MAYFSGGTSNGYITINLAVTEVSTDTANNTSTVSYTLSVSKSGSATERTWGQCSYAVNVGGNEDSGSSSVTVYPGDSTGLLGGTVTIPHNSDGTMSISCSGSISGKINGSCSGAMTLTTIPRGSDLIVPTFTLGQAGTITIDRKYTGFTDTIEFGYGKATGEIVKKTSATSVSYTFPLSYAEYTGASTYGTGWIRVTTYSGDTAIGSKSYTLQCNVPDSVKPSISGIAVAETNSDVPAVVGSGVFVSGKSVLKVSVTAGGDEGSWITAYSITAGGVTYSGNNITLPALNGTSIPVSVTVTDSRGRTASSSVTVTQLPYYAPAVSAFSCDRCTDEGADDDNGDYCKVKYTYKVYPLTVDSVNKNTVTAKIQARQHRDTEGSWTDLISIADASSETDDFSATDVSNYSTVEVSADYQWDIKFTITDSFGVASEVTIVLHSADVIMDFKSDGTGIAFSKTAELSDTADFGEWAVKAGGFLLGETQITDFVVASGTSGGWQYVKFNSGLAICTYQRRTGGIALTAWGNVYGSADNAISVLAYPFTFVSRPVEVVSLMYEAQGSLSILNGQLSNTVSQTGTYEVWRATQRTVSVYINYFVMGYWK